MKYKLFGATNLHVSVLGLGCSHIGKSFLADNTNASTKLLNTALENGINFFDLANIYSGGTAEEIVGATFKGKRKEIILATKGGKIPSKLAKTVQYFLPFAPIVRPFIRKQGLYFKKNASRRQCFDPVYLQEELESSLLRLKTDYVDFYQLHSPFISDLLTPGLFEWLASEKKSGRIRYYGVSVNTIEEAKWILDNENVDGLQIPYNMVDNEADTKLFPFLTKTSIGIVARIPFAQGRLTSAYKNMADPKMDFILSEKEIALTQGKTIECRALQYILSNPNVDVAIAGTINMKHLLQNIAHSESFHP